MKLLLSAGTVLAMALVCAPSASALPMPVHGTEGLTVRVGSASPVVATYQGYSSDYINDLFLLLDASGKPGDDGVLSNDLMIFSTASSTIGETRTLGTFLAGTELIFRIHVANTGANYFTGAAGRNPDQRMHARVQQEFLPGEALVSFEDLFDLPIDGLDYNDLIFSFSNTSSSAATIPEPASMMLFGLGLSGAAALRRRR
jgi:PEP-CTERM motif-containing protein